jgi:hypothetical protein
MLTSDGGRRQRRRGRGAGRAGRSLAGRSLAGSAATAVTAALVSDLRNAEGVLRPVLRAAAFRLVAAGNPLLGRVGRAYLRLDPPKVQVIEPGAAGQEHLPLALPESTGPVEPRG